MAFTLADMKQGMNDKVFDQVVDIFLRESEILQVLPFDDCVASGGPGSTRAGDPDKRADGADLRRRPGHRCGHRQSLL